ncbi:MAG: energy transducer TonB [Parahaliea sp.]
MKDNLARKPQLTVVEGGKPQGIAVPDIVPELGEPPVGEEKRRWWVPGKETSLWFTSLGLVLLVYAAPLAWWLWPDNAPGANLPPPAAMVVELAPAPVAPPAPAEQPLGPEQADAVPPPPERVPPPEPIPEPEPELPPLPEVAEAEVALVRVEEPPPVDTPVEEELPPAVEEPVEEELPPEKPVEASAASAPPETPEEDVTAAAPNQGVSSPVVDQNRVMNWQSSLMLKLNEAKRYPVGARRQRQEGVVYLRFAMDREGTVLSASIEQSSGYPLLDEETLALVERAQPLPKPPEDMAGVLEFVVPVEFFMNR